MESNKEAKNKIRINLIDQLRSHRAKPLGADPSILENALGKIVSLTEFHNSWTREGIFIDVPYSPVSFLTKYSPKSEKPCFLISPLDLEKDFLTMKDEDSYILRMTRGGGGYFEHELDLFGKPSLHFKKYSDLMDLAYSKEDGSSIYTPEERKKIIEETKEHYKNAIDFQKQFY